MDNIDCKILRCLKENARMNATTIGQRINLSTSSVIERMRRLERSGVIKQYTAVIDQSRIGKDITAYISIRLDHPKYNDGFARMIDQHEEIIACHYISGDFDYLLKVVTATSKSLEEVLNYIKSIEGVALTRTFLVLSTLKDDVCLLPQDAPEI